MPKFPATPAVGGRNIRQHSLAAAQTFKLGAAVLLDASEDIIEAGADPALIRGFAAEPAGKDPEGALKILVYAADQGEKFWMSGDNNPVKADINQSYGIVKDADGIWTVDGTEVVNTRVYVHQVDLDRNLYLVSVLEANRQAAA